MVNFVRMEFVGSKKEVKELCGQALAVFNSNGSLAFAESIQTLFLSKKIRFPLLEYAVEQCSNGFLKKTVLTLQMF